MIAIPFAILGIVKSFNLSLRVRQAKLLHGFFSDVKEGIRFTGAETYEIVNSLLAKDEYKCFRNNFADLSKEERTICKTAFSRLGKTDTYGQLEYLSGVSKKIEAIRIKAEQELQEKSKLYLTLGLCSGAMITIIII